MCRKSHEGIPVHDADWLTDVLEKVGRGGSFIGEDSTRQAARAAAWFVPDLGVHDSWESWTSAGVVSALEQARQRVDTPLSEHGPRPSTTTWKAS